MTHVSVERLKSACLTAAELEHISQCDFCAEHFGQICVEYSLPLPLPAREKILKKAVIYSPKYKKQQEYRRYCLKIGLSCLGAITLLATTNILNPKPKKEPKTGTIPTVIKINQATNELKDFFTFKEDANNEKTQ